MVQFDQLDNTPKKTGFTMRFLLKDNDNDVSWLFCSPEPWRSAGWQNDSWNPSFLLSCIRDSNLGVFHIYHLDIPKGAKWFLKDVNIPSLTVSLASLERCWYALYVFYIHITPQVELFKQKLSELQYTVYLFQNKTIHGFGKIKHWVNIWINQWFDDVVVEPVVEPVVKIPWWKERHCL